MIALALAIGLAAAAVEASPEVPQGVVLAPAGESAEPRARARLDAILSDGTHATLAAAMNAEPRAGRMPMLLGTFATLMVQESPGFDPSRLRSGKGKVPISSDVPMDFPILGATDPEQRDYLAARLRAVLPNGAPTRLRAPSFDELALIWFFIGWDLDAPLLVAEWEQQRFVFDFDASGERIDWIERLDRPCFTLRIESKQLLDCYCIGIDRRDRQWSAVYAPADATQTSNTCGK